MNSAVICPILVFAITTVEAMICVTIMVDFRLIMMIADSTNNDRVVRAVALAASLHCAQPLQQLFTQTNKNDLINSDSE